MSDTFEVPDDLSSLDQSTLMTHDEQLIASSKVNMMNFVIDAFTDDRINQYISEDAHICSYIRHLFAPSVTHLEMHKRIHEYVRAYSTLKRKYQHIPIQTEGSPMYDQFISEYNSILLPILEREGDTYC